jgi:hypothetical protein
MKYNELQATLKQMREDGHDVTVPLNAKKDILQAEYERLTTEQQPTEEPTLEELFNKADDIISSPLYEEPTEETTEDIDPLSTIGQIFLLLAELLYTITIRRYIIRLEVTTRSLRASLRKHAYVLSMDLQALRRRWPQEQIEQTWAILHYTGCVLYHYLERHVRAQLGELATA